jgi:hypothetical protein
MIQRLQNGEHGNWMTVGEIVLVVREQIWYLSSFLDAMALD